MAATFIGAANDPASGDVQSSSKAVNKPADAQLAVFFVCFWIGDGDKTITPPSGAVLRDSTIVIDTRTATYLKYIDGDATGTTYTFTFNASTWSALKAVFFADVDAGLDLATVPFNTANAAGTGYANTTVTTVIDAALAWSGNAAEYSTAGTHTQPTSFTETGDTDMSGSAYRISPGTGSQSASGASYTQSVSNKISTLLAIAPAAAADQDLNVGFHQQITSFFPMSVANQENLNLEIGFLDSSVALFTPSVANQSSLDLEISRIESSVAFFAPTLTIGDLQLDIPFLSSTTQLFNPSVANQSNLDTEIGFISSSSQLFSPIITNQLNDEVLIPFTQFLQAFFQPLVFNEGEQVFEPTLVGNGSLADRIIAGLIDQGFTTGSITDREYARLLAKLTLIAPQPYSISDLYALAEEPNRLYGVGVDNLGVLA